MSAQFLESPRFPDTVAFGFVGGPSFKTHVLAVGSGHEFRDRKWAEARGKWTCRKPLASDAALAEAIAFFRAVAGRAVGFRFRDWTDYEATVSTGRLGTLTNADGSPSYQLHKAYVAGALTHTREIVKPVAEGLTIYRAGVAKTITTHYTIDTATGVVTWVPDLARSVAAISNASNGVLRTTTNHGLSNGQVAYLSGIGGMTQLNGQKVTVTVVDADEVTIGVNTTGYGTYTSGGTLALYPQPSEVLAWAGEFDCAVRFDTDELRVEIADKDVYFADGLPIVEIRV